MLITGIVLVALAGFLAVVGTNSFLGGVPLVALCPAFIGLALMGGAILRMTTSR
jgi:hypothetical protein